MCAGLSPHCRVLPCARSSRRRWACESVLTPNPTGPPSTLPPPVGGYPPSSAVSPSPSQDVPLPSPPPLFNGTFIIADVNNVNRFTLPDPSDGSSVFDIFYNVTVASDGVVALASRPDLIQSVTCLRTGAVRVVLLPSAPVQDLREMYPPGATLVVDSATFGPCFLGDLASPAGDIIRNIEQFADGYLKIQTVIGSPRNALISGEPVTWFDMFDMGVLTISRRQRTAVDREVVATEAQTGLRKDSRQVETGLKISKSFELSLLELTVTGSIADKGSFKLLSAEWGSLIPPRLPKIEVLAVSKLEISASLEATWVGNKPPEGSDSPLDLFSAPIPSLAIPSLNVLSGKEILGIKLPPLKAGVYAEVKLIRDIKATLTQSFTTESSLSFKAPETEIQAYIRGFSLGIENPKTLAPATFGRSLVPNFDRTTSSSLELNLNVFLGIQPSFALYIPLFVVRLSADAGVEFTANARILGGPYLPTPVPSSVIGLGNCETCHYIQTTAGGKVQNVQISTELLIEKSKLGVFKDVAAAISQTIPITRKPSLPSSNHARLLPSTVPWKARGLRHNLL